MTLRKEVFVQFSELDFLLHWNVKSAPVVLLFRSRGSGALALLSRLGAWWLVLRDARGAKCDGGFLCIGVWLWVGRGFSGVHGPVLLGDLAPLQPSCGHVLQQEASVAGSEKND